MSNAVTRSNRFSLLSGIASAASLVFAGKDDKAQAIADDVYTTAYRIALNPGELASVRAAIGRLSTKTDGNKVRTVTPKGNAGAYHAALSRIEPEAAEAGARPKDKGGEAREMADRIAAAVMFGEAIADAYVTARDEAAKLRADKAKDKAEDSPADSDKQAGDTRPFAVALSALAASLTGKDPATVGDMAQYLSGRPGLLSALQAAATEAAAIAEQAAAAAEALQAAEAAKQATAEAAKQAKTRRAARQQGEAVTA